MVVEKMPAVFGAIVILMGMALVWDAWGPQTVGPMRDRRRRTRVRIDLKGELIAGVGIVLLGAAVMRPDWRMETVIVIAATVCIAIGALRNWKYFREVFMFRGAARRNTSPESTKSGKLRIR